MNRPHSRAIVPVADDVGEIVCALVRAEPPPIKRAYAIVARSLGISVRRVRMYWHREVDRVSLAEAIQIQARHADALRARIRRVKEEQAALEERLDRLGDSRGANLDRKNMAPRRDGVERRSGLLSAGRRALP